MKQSRQMKYYYKNRELIRDKQKSYQWSNKVKLENQRILGRLNKAEWLEKYKRSRYCKNCGLRFSQYPVMADFHHIDPSTKINHIAEMVNSSYSLDTLKAEIKKCILLCANCHRVLHYIDRIWPDIKENTNER